MLFFWESQKGLGVYRHFKSFSRNCSHTGVAGTYTHSNSISPRRRKEKLAITFVLIYSRLVVGIECLLTRLHNFSQVWVRDGLAVTVTAQQWFCRIWTKDIILFLLSFFYIWKIQLLYQFCSSQQRRGYTWKVDAKCILLILQMALKRPIGFLYPTDIFCCSFKYLNSQILLPCWYKSLGLKQHQAKLNNKS